MKTFTFTFALKCLFPFLILFFACESGFSQTFLNVEPERIAEVIAEGKVRTYDMKKMPGSPDAVNRGAASTRQMTDAIIQKLKP